MKWNIIEDNGNMPDECRPVILKGTYDGCDGCFIIATMVMNKWVTDASTAEIYGSKAHCELVDFEPEEWSYIV